MTGLPVHNPGPLALSHLLLEGLTFFFFFFNNRNPTNSRIIYANRYILDKSTNMEDGLRVSPEGTISNTLLPTPAEMSITGGGNLALRMAGQEGETSLETGCGLGGMGGKKRLPHFSNSAEILQIAQKEEEETNMYHLPNTSPALSWTAA